MFWAIGFLLLGICLGFLLLHRNISRFMERGLSCIICVLLFLMGISIGSNDVLMRSLPQLGWHALLLTLAAIIGSVLCAALLWKYVFARTSSRQ